MALAGLKRWLGWRGEKPNAVPPRAEKTRARTVYGSADRPNTLTEKQADHSKQVNETLRMSMMGQGPGWWASDHAEEAQHFTSWNYCAIHSKAKQAAQASIRVFKRTPKKPDDTTRTKSSAHDQQEYDRTPLPPANDLVRLLEKPNPRWSGALWRYQIIQQLDLTGSALLWKVRDRGGKLSELWVIPTALARPQMPSASYPLGAYWVTATGLFTLTGGLAPIPSGSSVGAAAGILIDARDMHPIRWPHAILMADGQSPLNAGSVQTDLAEEIDQAAWAAMNNVVDPSVILSINGTQQVDAPELDRIEEMIKANRGGSAGRGKIWIIQDCKPEQVHRSPAELDYKDSRTQARDGVLSIQGMPGVACGMPSDTGTYSAYYVQLKQAIELTIQPELDLIASELTRLLHEESGDESLEVQISAKSFDDPEVMDRRLGVMIQAGNAVTVKEFRAQIGLPPFGDERDDEFVGVRKSLREQVEDDSNPDLPGVQVGEGDAGNDASDESSTGVKKKPAGPSVRDKMYQHLLNGFHVGAGVN